MNPAPVERRLLTSKEAANYLAISPRKLWSLQIGRGIPSLRIGRKVLFDRADLDTWIERQKAVRK